MKIYLHGRDNVGWSIDHDRKYTENFLKEIGHSITNSIVKADVVHSVWWDQLLSRRNVVFRLKKNIIATATNSITPENKGYIKAKKWISFWIAPSRTQFETLRADGVRVAYQPFYVDEKIFRKLGQKREDLSALLGIRYELIKGKVLIGSFQRDTLGSDLKSPKWQKGPELLIELLSELPNKDKWTLVLAGPRRHFVINECEKRGIPFYYCGQKPALHVDDIEINTLSLEKMAQLYNLIDCYLVTSRSEGGPKAILEASFCRTLVFSTPVGLAPDILNKQCIYSDVKSIQENLLRMTTGNNCKYFDGLVASNFNNVNSLCSYEATKNRWKMIYASI